jgi:hypothetical protein
MLQRYKRIHLIKNENASSCQWRCHRVRLYFCKSILQIFYQNTKYKNKQRLVVSLRAHPEIPDLKMFIRARNAVWWTKRAIGIRGFRGLIACVCIFVNQSCKYFTKIQTHQSDRKCNASSCKMPIYLDDVSVENHKMMSICTIRVKGVLLQSVLKGAYYNPCWRGLITIRVKGCLSDHWIPDFWCLFLVRKRGFVPAWTKLNRGFRALVLITSVLNGESASRVQARLFLKWKSSDFRLSKSEDADIMMIESTKDIVSSTSPIVHAL